MVSARGRPHISSPHFAFFILSFISAAHGIRHNHGSNQCHIGCHGSGGGLGFEDGFKYEYKYEGSSRMLVGGSSEDLAPLDLSATVSITPISACNLHLQLSDVYLLGPNKKTLESGSINKGSSGIVAGLDSTGKLVGQICTPSDQSNSFTNLHRAVLSLLQSHIPKHVQPSLNATLHQTDIFGVCSTDYSVKESDEEINVLSTRDLDSCAHREDARLPIVTSPYHSKSGFDRTHILEGTQTREQKFLQRILQEAKSREFYTLAPISDESAASVTVTSKLILVNKIKSGSPPVVDKYEGKSVIFEVVDDAIGTSTYDEIKKALVKISDGKVTVIKENNPREFNQFVKKLAGANKQDIMNLLIDIKEGNDFKNKMNARRILLDGLVESGSSASVEVMSELLKSGGVSEYQARSWLMSFPNTKRVTLEALSAAKEILEREITSIQAYLGIGALVGKFCIQQDCRNLEIVNSIEELMIKSLFETCKPTNIIVENNVIAGLKGLGNIRFLSEKVAQRLSECTLDKQAWVRIRVAALETMKTDSKNAIIRETVEMILRDSEEDSEVRIKAYLTLVEKPSGQVAEIVKEVLTTEKSNQVGGFIVSHLRNVRSSTNPDKEALRHHLGGIYTRSGKFGWDPKKYSQNYEISYIGEEWGAAAESNVIYSHHGYLPRSLNFNLTTVLYGHSFNLFEFGIRSEGTEKIFERFLKTLTLKRETLNDLLKNGTDLADEVANKFSSSLRPKRSVDSQKVNDFYEKMEKLPKVYHDEMMMDFSFKSLGAEVGFFSHLGDDIGPKRSIDQFFSGLEYTVDSAKNLNIEYSKHSTFLEGEIIYPTGLGLPMRLKTKGSAAFGLTADAKLDLPSVLQNPYETHHMKLKIIPSGSVEVVGALTIDASNVETGIEVTLAAHSSTGGDVNLKMIKGKELELVLGVPLREQKIISASTGLSSVFRLNQDVTTTPIDLDINKVSIEEYSGCFEQMVTATGLTFCGEVSVPNNNLPTVNPFYGPSKVAFSIHVEDDSITSYVFKTSYERLKEKNKQKLHILLDTPGSQVNRKVSIGYESEVNPQLKHMKFYLDSFWKSMSVQGSMIETAKELSVSGKLKYDQQEFSTKAGVTLSKSSPTITVYKPFFQYSFPQYQSRLVSRSSSSSPLLKFSGEVIVERKEEDGLTTYLFNHLTVETNRSNYTIDGSVSSQIKGDSSTLNSDLKIMYDEEYIAINSTVSRLGTTRLDGNLIVFPSQNPELAISAQGRVESTSNQDFKFLAEFDFTHGPDPDNKDMRFSFVNEVLVSGLRENSVKFVAIKYQAGYPPTGLNFVSDFEWLPGTLKYRLDSKLDDTSANFKLTASTDPAGLYDVYLAAKLMDKGFKLEARREMVDSNKSKFTNALEIFPEKLFQLNALVSHKFAWADLDFSIQSEIKTPLRPQQVRISTGIQNNDEKFLLQYFFEADAKVYVDFFTERIKGPISKGNFKLILTDYIDSKGDFGFEDSVLKGSGFVIFLKSQSKIDAAVDMIIKQLKYGGTIDLTWTATPNDAKTLKIVTENDLENSLFDTKNTITYEGQENQLNFNVKRTEHDLKGTMNIEMELKLGDCDHVVAKYGHNINAIPNDAEGDYTLDINHKATSQANPTKILLQLVGKHVDFDEGKIDGQLTATYTTPQGKDVAIQLAHKKIPKDEKWIVNSLFDASGTLMQAPVNLKLDSELARSLFADTVSWSRVLPPSSYRIVASFGTDMSLDAYGKMTGNTYSGEINLKLPQDYKLSTFKWSTINLAQLNPGPDNQRQIKMSNLFKWNEKFFEIDNEFILLEEGGSIKFDWETDSTKKRSLYLISHWPKRDEGVVDFDVSFKYDKDGKPSDAFFKYSANYIKGEGNLHFHGTCPANGIYDLKVASKRFHEGKGFHIEWVLVANNKTRKGLYKILRLQDHPYIEYYVEDENNAKSGFLVKADKKGMGEWTGNVHVEWAMEPGKKGFFYVNSEMKLVSMDNFQVKLEANSNKYHLKDWIVEVYSDQALQTIGSRNVAFRMKHDSQILLNGTASYDLNYIKDGIYKIEAKGNAMIEGTLQPISMKAMWKPSHPRKGFNGSLIHGENTLMIESVFDDSDIYYVRKYCSPKLEKKCSESRIIWNSVESADYEEDKKLDVVLDLSSMNPSLDDFILKATLKRNKNIVDHKVELKWLKDRMFTYKGYIYEDKAGLTIGLPKRTISGDVAFQFPHDVNHGRLFIEANLWLNKLNEPEKKTYFLVSGEITRDKDLYACTTEARLTHPVLQKDYAMKGKATVGKSWSKPKSDGHFEFDVFKNTDDTITLTWNMGNNDEKSSYSSHNSIIAKSKGLKMDMGYDRRVAMTKMSISWIDSIFYLDENGEKKEAFVKVDIKPKKFLLSFKLPDVQMYDVSFNLERKDRKVSLLGSYELAGTKYKEVIHINNYNNVNYQFQFGKGKTFFLDFGFAFGQMAEFKASMNKNSIYEWEVALNEADFLKTKYYYNKDNFNKFWETLGEEVSIIANSYDNEIKRAVDRDGKALSELVQRIGRAVADPSPLLQSYKQDAENILKEILEDEALRDAVLPLRELLSSAVEQCVEIIEEVIKLTQEMSCFCQRATDYVEAIISSISAKIKETSKAVTTALGRIIESLLDAYLNFIDQLCAEINKHHEQIQIAAIAISEFAQDMGRLAAKFGSQMKQEIDEFIRISWEEIKTMPLFHLIEEKFQELKNYRVSEGFWPDLQEILRVVAESAPNPELRRFITTLTNYIDQFLKEETLDMDAAFRQIYNEFIASIKPTMDSIYDAFSYEETLFNNKFWIPMPWISMWKTGSSSGGIKLSTIKWILSGDLPSFVDYALHSWNSFCHVFPPYKARAYLISSEMVTYDGREVSLVDGTYVLTQELDNKFTVLAEIKNSVIASIQLVQGTDSVHFTPDGKVWLNGKELEHNIKSKDGKPGARFTLSGSHMDSEEVSVVCQSDLTMCRLSLKGPAFAKVRGVLGTYNYESFDEYTLPTGKVSSSEEEFLNSWKLEGNSEVKKAHSHRQQPRCTHLFTSSNQLMLCYRLVDPKPFREMCDHAVEKATSPEAKKKALCQSIQHYTRACRANNLKISLPPPCDVCDVNGKEVTTDEVKLINTAEKKADIVFMVELNSENAKIYEGLLVPLTQKLDKELNKAGINDVEYGLVGFGSKDHSYLNYFKRDGKLQFKESIPKSLPWENQSSQLKKYFIESNATLVDKFWHTIDKFFIADDETERGIVRTGITKSYPWRAGSYRSLVTLVSSPCPLPEPILSPLTRIKMAQRLMIMKSYGIVYNLITPVQEIIMPSMNTNEILGFSKDELYLMNRFESGSAAKEMKQAMSYLYDACHLFPMETGGNVIVADNLKSGNNAVEGVAKIVAKSLLNQKMSYQCQCTINHGLQPKYECIAQS